MLRLRTFGGLWIEGSIGADPAAPPPRRLALLAVLAAAGPRGVSRERLLGILWPDGEEERGRHALAQTVYSLRRDLNAETPIVGANELRLDPAVLGSDIGDFNAAMLAGDRDAAARLYAGPFLDGFYLSGAPEFERWVEEERARVAKQVASAIDALAQRSEREERQADTTALRHRLTELDPLSGKFAAEYMKALSAGGDRAGALAHARAHEATIRRELETAPDPEVTGLAERLRGDQKSGRPAATPPVTAAEGAVLAPFPAHRQSLTVPALIGAIVVTALIVGWRLLVSPPRREPPLLAVGVLRDIATRDSTSSGGVLTDMLATSLARIPGLQVVANSRLVELMPRGADTLPGALSDAARRAGAKEILEGEFSFAPDGGLRLEFRRIDLASGVVRHGYSVHAFDRYAAVDSATAAIAADLGFSAPTRTIADVTTSSPLAYRLYEEGLRAYYQYDAPAAYRLMEAALREDSTFAMAAFYSWQSGSALGGQEQALRERAVRLAPRATDPERLLILGTTGVSQEDPAALAPAESLAIRFPADPEGQALLGQVQMHRGYFGEAAAAFARAIALDSAGSAKPDAVCRACAILGRLFGLYSAWDSTPAAERVVRSWVGFRPRAPEPMINLAEIRWRQERWAEADTVLALADSFSNEPRNLEPSLYRALIRRGSYDELGREAAIALRDPDGDRRNEARWLWLIALRNQGRLREAAALLREGRVPGDGTVPLSAFDPDGINRASLAFEAGDYRGAAEAYRAQAALVAAIPSPGHRARGLAWNLTLAGTAYAAAGDTATVRRLADSVETLGPQSLFGRGARLHHFLRGLLLADAGRPAEAVDAYRRAILSWTEGYTRINFEMSRGLLTLHRPKEAIYPLQAALRGGIDASNLYLTRTELHELLAQAFIAVGRPDSAAVHYREVARAWEKGGPPFQARRRVALDWLARHGP